MPLTFPGTGRRAGSIRSQPCRTRNAYGAPIDKAGVRFVTIQGYVDTGIYAWDHHWGYPHLDIQLLSTIKLLITLEDLHQRGR